MSDTRYPRLAYDNQGDVGIDAPLQSGGGGSTFDPMEARVTRLENQYERLESKVDEMRIDVAVLKERISHLPTKGFVVTATVTTLGLLTAVILFQDRLTAWLGMPPA